MMWVEFVDTAGVTPQVREEGESHGEYSTKVSQERIGSLYG
jgi:hypothetical protein